MSWFSYAARDPSCSLEFSQKAAACNYVRCGHLNIALACLYCNFKHNPKMQWYSASAWEHHTLAHSEENLPNHPDDVAFSQHFAYVSEGEAMPSTSGFVTKLPHAVVIHKWAEAAKHFLEEGSGQSTFHLPLFEDSAPSPHEATKHCVKQGLVKSSKKLKKTKEAKSKMMMSKFWVTYLSSLSISPC